MSAMRKFTGEGSPAKGRKSDGAPDKRRAGKGRATGNTPVKSPGSYKPRGSAEGHGPSGEGTYKSRKPYGDKGESSDTPRSYKGTRDDKPLRPWKRNEESGAPRANRYSDNKPAGDRPYRSRKADEGQGESTGSARPYKGSRDERPSRPWKRDEETSSPRKPRFSDDKPAGDRPYRSRNADEGQGESTGSSRPYKGSRDERPSKPWKRDEESSSPRKPRFSDDKPAGGRPYRSRRADEGQGESTGSSRPYKGNRDERPSRPWKRDEESSFPRKPRFSDDKPAGDRPYRSRKTDEGHGENPEAPRSYRGSTDDKPVRPRRREEESGAPRERRYSESKPGGYKRDQSPVIQGPKDKKGYGKDGQIRLNKFIANAGVCSRREADTLIESGAVSVNGIVVTELGTKVTREDKVQFGGETLNIEKKVYLLLNKPKGYITTVDDPQERNTVMMLIKDACKERVYPVGRLDRNTSGLLLFTNDGEIAKKLTHPGHKVRKVYHVELSAALSKGDMLKLSEGVELEDGMMAVDEIAYTGAGNDKKNIGVVIHSGKNRVVRRLFEALEYEVVKLDRVAFANLTKKDLPRGRWRLLDQNEINMLMMI